MNEVTVHVDHDNNQLTINTNVRYQTFSDLMDALGEVDIVTASEVEQTYIAHEGDIYDLPNSDAKTLMKGGHVVLDFVVKVANCDNKEFIEWYY